jgi:bifunctional ADP-heptose synthase (sugar kinase/adenylyltransferase)
MRRPVVEELADNPSLFARRKVVVVGDIAFDRSFRCRTPEPDFHATHAQETIFDVEPGGDDCGAVGSANNVCLACAALGARTSLWTITGDDEEGLRVSALLRSQANPARVYPLKGLQTITRLRFFVLNRATAEYRLAFRVDKEPDYEAAAKGSAALVSLGPFSADLEADLLDADALVLNDTEKGMLCPDVIEAIGGVVKRVRRNRLQSPDFPLTVLVDPKFEWRKFCSLPVDVLKPNSREALRAAGLSSEGINLSDDGDLRRLGERLVQSFGTAFPRTVITLGPFGAALLETSGKAWRLTRFPPFPSSSKTFDASTHCGDVFGAALALAVCRPTDWPAAITFANLVASRQHSKPTAARVALSEIVGVGASEGFRSGEACEPVVVSEGTF